MFATITVDAFYLLVYNHSNLSELNITNLNISNLINYQLFYKLSRQKTDTAEVISMIRLFAEKQENVAETLSR